MNSRLMRIVVTAAVMVTLGLSAFLARTADASSGSTALASTGIGKVWEQQMIFQQVQLNTNNVPTVLSTSPVLPVGSYLVNSDVTLYNLQPGDEVLCGFATTANNDTPYGNFGALNYAGTTTGSLQGNCAATGIMQIKNTNDHITAWATIYSGPAGAFAGAWSTNETPVANAIVTNN